MKAETSPRVSFMGPAGTFSHVAARTACPGATHVDAPTIASVVEGVASGSVAFGVMSGLLMMAGRRTQGGTL